MRLHMPACHDCPVKHERERKRDTSNITLPESNSPGGRKVTSGAHFVPVGRNEICRGIQVTTN